jgi:hypothetical protein
MTRSNPKMLTSAWRVYPSPFGSVRRTTMDLAAWFSFQRAGQDLRILRYCRPNAVPVVL